MFGVDSKCNKSLEGLKEGMFTLDIEGTVKIFPMLTLQICIGSYISQLPPLCFLVNTPFSDYSLLLFLSLISVQAFHFVGAVGPQTKPSFYNNHSGVCFT